MQIVQLRCQFHKNVFDVKNAVNFLNAGRYDDICDNAVGIVFFKIFVKEFLVFFLIPYAPSVLLRFLKLVNEIIKLSKKLIVHECHSYFF